MKISVLTPAPDPSQRSVRLFAIDNSSSLDYSCHNWFNAFEVVVGLVGGRDDGGHWVINFEDGWAGYRNLYYFVGVLFDGAYDEVDFREEVGEVS